LNKKPKLLELAGLFLKLGAVGFGGPTALIALMETELVQKRKWVTHKQFMDMLAVTYLIPGPNAVEMAHFLGYASAGLGGLLISGICFILPPTFITLLFAYFYARFGTLPEVQVILASITPMVISIILDSGYRIGRSALKNLPTILIFLACFIAAIIGMDNVLITFLAGFLSLTVYFINQKKATPLFLFTVPIIRFHHLLNLDFLNDKKAQLFLYFLKIGAVLFGSGHVLFAYINNDVVNRFNWLTSKQLVDAIAIGQITPGPVSSSVTFIGYLIEGIPGAISSTFAFFLPSFIFVLLIEQFLLKIVKSPAIQSFFDGVNASVVALIIVVAINLMRSSIINVGSGLIFLLSLIILIKYKIDPALLVLSGALLGLIKIVLIK